MAQDPTYTDDPVNVYVTLLRQVPALNAVEESRCIGHAQANDPEAEVARARLVEANLQLVVSIAERYSGHQVHILELIETGNQALFCAVGSLADCSPASFSAHAAQFIERAIAEAVATSNPTAS